MNNDQVSTNTSVTEYSLNTATGQLTSMGNVTLASANRVSDIAVDPVKHRLYVVDMTSDTQPDAEVWTYNVDPASGKVTLASSTSYDAHASLAAPVVDVQSRWIFSSEFKTPSLFHSLILDPNSGVVTQQGETTQVSQASDSVMPPAVEPSGKYVYAANATANTLWGFSINGSSGTLTEVPNDPYKPGATNGGCSPKVAFCEAPIAFANGYLYMVDSAYPELVAYKINAADGSLTAVPGSPFITGNSSYDAIVTTPNGKFVYAVSNIANTIAGWSLNSTTGVAVPIPGSPWPMPGSSYWPAVVVDSTGQYLYASNTQYLTGWKIDPTTGALTALSGSPFVSNGTATNMAIVP